MPNIITDTSVNTPHISIIGGGPAGLMAAEVLLNNNIHVALYDAMPSVGRKFLMAGKSGLNLTHNEAFEQFIQRYGTEQQKLAPLIQQFGSKEIRQWAQKLGIETYIGTSQRIFPIQMKAAPLLRAWLHKLRGQGLKIHVRHRWLGWDADDNLVFDTPNGQSKTKSTATLLALGGASWPQLGSTGSWQTLLRERNVDINPLVSANCGFNYPWSDLIKQQHAGEAVKSVEVSFLEAHGQLRKQSGDFVVSEYGIEGSLIYAFTSSVRQSIEKHGHALLHIDLSPNKTLAQLQQSLSQARGSNTLAKHIHRHTGIKGIKAKLLRELSPNEAYNDPHLLAQYMKALPMTIKSIRPIAEAISSAGGVKFENLDKHLMISKLPGVFCAGEMLDWEAPTGGYLFTGCFATGYAAGQGVTAWLRSKHKQPPTS